MKNPRIIELSSAKVDSSSKLALKGLHHPGLVKYNETSGGNFEFEAFQHIDWSEVSIQEKTSIMKRVHLILEDMKTQGLDYGGLGIDCIVRTQEGIKLSRIKMADCNKALDEILAHLGVRHEDLKDSPAKFNSRRQWSFKLLAFAMLGSLCAAGYQYFDIQGLWEDFSIEKKSGPKASYEHFRKENVKKRAFKDAFGQAWSAFGVKKYKESEVLLSQAFDLAKTQKEHGMVHYLQAYLALDQNDPGRAEESFEGALQLFIEIGYENNIHRCLIGLARISLAENDFVVAEEYLDRAFKHQGKGLSLGIYYHTRARLSFKVGLNELENGHPKRANDNFEDALGKSLSGITHLENDKYRKSHTISDAGFYYMILGHFQEGVARTDEASKMLVQHSDEDLYHTNLINYIFYRRCNGLEYGHLVGQVAEYGEKTANQDILDFLDVALMIECPSIRVGSGPPEPPVDPDVGTGGSTGGNGGNL